MYNAFDQTQNICFACQGQVIRFKIYSLHRSGINTEHYIARTQTLLHMSENRLSKRGMILGILVVVTVISCEVYRSLPTADHEHPLMHYTKLISLENFTAGRP